MSKRNSSFAERENAYMDTKTILVNPGTQNNSGAIKSLMDLVGPQNLNYTSAHKKSFNTNNQYGGAESSHHLRRSLQPNRDDARSTLSQQSKSAKRLSTALLHDRLTNGNVINANRFNELDKDSVATKVKAENHLSLKASHLEKQYSSSNNTVTLP